MKVWLAVVDGRFGYALDLYPEERDRLRELGCAVVGEFTIRQDAIDAAAAALASRPPMVGRQRAPRGEAELRSRDQGLWRTRSWVSGSALSRRATLRLGRASGRSSSG